MTLIKTTLSVAVVACGLAAGMLGSGSPPASAQPAPPAPVQGEQPPAWAPPKAAEFQGEQPPAWAPPKAAEFWSEPPPAWAPPKPAEFWNGQPVVWDSAWGGRWGVWTNGGFIILTSNPVTGGG